MSPGLKQFARDWLPPAALRLARSWTSRPAFSGRYATWADARAAASGYEHPAIFEKALAAARAVRDGQAAFERDSVTFAEPAIHGPLLAGLLRSAARNQGRLRVVDFGGGFGSAWWQHRNWLGPEMDVVWEVIEQPHFVRAGKTEFEVGPLRFHHSLDECTAKPADALILLSSVLPYLEDPHRLVADIVQRGFGHVLIDRTGFTGAGDDRLTLQRVPKSIYEATYPSWFFNRERLMRSFLSDYTLVAEWPSFDAVNIDATFRGCLLERKVR